LLEELARRQNGYLVAENEQVGISGNHRHLLARGKSEQVIIAGVCRPNRRRPFGIGNELGQRAKHVDEAIGVCRCDAFADLRITQRPVDLCKQRLADDELELTGKPELEEPCRRACPRDQRRDENVGVEDNAHTLGRTTLMLSLHGERVGFVFGENGSTPDPFE
jgi:hypothetical protein